MEGAETMKVAVSDLVANPYRKILKYPIRREKVDHLKSSIGDTGFWDNILARKVGDEYQIAYGHHRLTALRELDIKEVDIPVKDLDDSIMIKIMANENMEEWESNTSVINETILTVKEYLARSRGIAVGEPEILKFLGSSWKQETVRNALATIKDDDKSIDREAVEVFPSPFHAQTFRREPKKLPQRSEDRHQRTYQA